MYMYVAFILMSFVVSYLFMKVTDFVSHFYVEFTENVKIDLTGAIQMFTNTGTYSSMLFYFGCKLGSLPIKQQLSRNICYSWKVCHHAAFFRTTPNPV